MVNGSLVVLIGQTIKLEEDVQVIIDCSQLIDAVANNETFNPNVTWYKNEIQIVNGSAINAEISSDTRFCIINCTLSDQVGSGENVAIDENFGSANVDFGTSGNYTCEVCNVSTCINLTSPKFICGK